MTAVLTRAVCVASLAAVGVWACSALVERRVPALVRALALGLLATGQAARQGAGVPGDHAAWKPQMRDSAAESARISTRAIERLKIDHTLKPRAIALVESERRR